MTPALDLLDPDRLTVGWLVPTFAAVDGDAGATGRLLELAERADAAGFDALWLPDSPVQYRLPDPLVILGAIAARTRTAALGTGVLLAALRHPHLLAHTYATLDALSEGRVIAGLGAGFGSDGSKAQFDALGVPFAGRGNRLQDTILRMRGLWGPDGDPSPRPIREGGPPIWLAGAGVRAQARAAQLADGWLPYLPDPADYARAAAHVRAEAEARGRPAPPVHGLYLTIAIDDDPERARRRLAETVERWYGAPLSVVSSFQAMYAGPLDGLADHLAPYRDAGLRHVVLRVAAEPEVGLEVATAARGMLIGRARRPSDRAARARAQQT